MINDTDVTIKEVETKLVEKYIFTSHGGQRVKLRSDIGIDITDSKIDNINCFSTKNFDIEIPLPSELTSFDHSEMVSRNYFVVITVVLPIPHRNVVLKIPVQIGVEGQEVLSSDDNASLRSDWEAMDVQENGEDSDYENEQIEYYTA